MPKKIVVCYVESSGKGTDKRSRYVEISALKDILPQHLKRFAGPAATSIITSGVTTVTLSNTQRVEVISTEEVK